MTKKKTRAPTMIKSSNTPTTAPAITPTSDDEELDDDFVSMVGETEGEVEGEAVVRGPVGCTMVPMVEDLPSQDVANVCDGNGEIVGLLDDGE